MPDEAAEERMDEILDGQAERVTIDGATVTYRKVSEIIEAHKFKKMLDVDPFDVLWGNTRKVTH